MYTSSFDKFHVIIACCEGIYSRYCTQKTNNDHLPKICHYRLKDIKLILHFLLSRINNSTAISCIGKFYHFSAPW